MAIRVIGVGVGRTGTYSLKLALNQLGFGPCHHMDEVLKNLAVQVPLWSAALDGRPDWDAIYSGFSSAVDWPTAGFCRELVAAYPKAKFILTLRSPEQWVESFGETIYKVLAMGDEAPPEKREWLAMASGVIARTGFPRGLDREGLVAAFNAHTEAVRRTVPADRLLVFDVKEGWAPLCQFLAKPKPAEPFPRTNDRAEFWDRVTGKV